MQDKHTHIHPHTHTYTHAYIKIFFVGLLPIYTSICVQSIPAKYGKQEKTGRKESVKKYGFFFSEEKSRLVQNTSKKCHCLTTVDDIDELFLSNEYTT